MESKSMQIRRNLNRSWVSEEGLPMPHDKLCKIPLEPGDLLRHLEQLWDEVQALKREVRLLKGKNDG